MSDHYIARPVEPPLGGVLVLHAWWGLTPFIKSFCDRLAGSGFFVLAPDLYRGASAATIEQAKKLRGKLKQAEAEDLILRSAQELRDQCKSDRIGVVGFSLGAYYGIRLTVTDKSVAATVAFYGLGPGDFTACQAAFQFHLAETDPYVSKSGVKTMQKALKAAGCAFEINDYPGTGHWFFESDQPAFHSTSAELAWTRTLSFLRHHLGG